VSKVDCQCQKVRLPTHGPLQRYVATLQLKPGPTATAPSGIGSRPSTRRPAARPSSPTWWGEAFTRAGFEALRRHLRQAAIANAAGRGRGGTRWRNDRSGGGAQGLWRFDQLSFDNIAVPAPGPREVRIRQAAAGVNYIDVYIGRGEYRMIEPPASLGMEAAGTVIDVGSEVHDILPGDRVAYAYGKPGAYATLRTLPAIRSFRCLPASMRRPRRRSSSRA